MSRNRNWRRRPAFALTLVTADRSTKTLREDSDVVCIGDAGDGGSGSKQFGADRLDVERGQCRGAGPDHRVLAAGADEVSAAVASLFSGHAQAYQTLGTQAAAFHERFIQALSTAAGAYGSAEAANASPLQQALNVINAPTQTLLGRPLIGNGTNGAPGTGQAGGPGGLLYGNGGNGGSGGSAKPAEPAAAPG